MRQLKAKTKPWPVQDAKARFSALPETCLREGPQVVTKRGSETAVLVPAKDWKSYNILCSVVNKFRFRGDVKDSVSGEEGVLQM
ncbi:MAG TPA: type II toxin-antitoxin system Phd/YefM family antitoxin [Dongiaceae bacterium]|nr:type II toxin-antitoxin system Phd/YefM family antitoxin [Dongiaceae bacterium]